VTDVNDIKQQLLQGLEYFREAHLCNTTAQRSYRQLATALETVQTSVAAAVAAEKGADGKKLYGNPELRADETQRRIAEQAPELLKLHAEADEERRATQAELERAHEVLKTLRALAELTAQELRLQACTKQAEISIADIEIPF
jgi:flagellar motor protein MotB